MSTRTSSPSLAEVDRDTIVAHSSGRPPAAIAVLRVSGPAAHQAAAPLVGSLPQPRRTALRKVRDRAGQLLDEALVLRFDAPASATGEDLVELHCHGGRAVVAAVLAALTAEEGIRAAEPGEFTRRALLNGRIDLTEAEGLADLLEAETEAQRRAAVGAAGGALRQQIEDWRRRIIDCSAQAEAAIDYVGDEDETAFDHRGVQEAIAALAREWREWLARPRTDILRRGARVVLAGPPNAGKSSLLNALVGEERAIVTAIPGTTRDLIEVPLALGGVPLLLVDTAGLRETGDEVERIGVGRAEEQLRAADILLWLGEPTDVPSHPRILLIHAQADRRPKGPAGSLPVSVITGEGVRDVVARIQELAAELFPLSDQVALNERQAKLINEALQALEQPSLDLVILAEQLRQAREALDRVTGVNGTEQMLDALFGRFCLGK